MRDFRTKPVQENDGTGSNGVEPGYDVWATAKIEAALADAIAHPERRVGEAAVWKKFGLER